MSLPPLSIICPTYGRTACVAELLQCFKLCEYDGELELLLLNDVAEQTLYADTTTVDYGRNKTINIINRELRYDSLGGKRNDTVMWAAHEHFLFVDDDDIFLPWYPSDMMTMFQVWEKPTYPVSFIHADGKGASIQMTYKKQTHPASYLATKKQFHDVGGYPFVYAGGDQLIRSKLFKQFDCQPSKHPRPIWRAGYVYRWANGTYHISGNSDHATAWTRTNDNLQRRLESGDEPMGFISLEPKWDIDYQELSAKVNK